MPPLTIPLNLREDLQNFFCQWTTAVIFFVRAVSCNVDVVELSNGVAVRRTIVLRAVVVLAWTGVGAVYRMVLTTAMYMRLR